MMQIPDLGALFSSDPGAFAQGQRLLGLNEMFARNNDARQLQELELRRQAESRLGANQAAQLEIQRAQERRAQQTWDEQAPLRGLRIRNEQQKLDFEEKEHPLKLERLEAEAKTKRQRDQLERMRNLATAMNQAAEINETLGPGAAKEHLIKAGFEGWDPRWEDPKILSQDGLTTVLRDLGGRLTQASSDFQQKFLLQNDKQEAQAAIEAQRAAARERTAQIMAEARMAIEKFKNDNRQNRDPKTFQEAAVRLRQLATQTQDPELRAFYAKEAETMLEAAQSVAAMPKADPVLDPNIAPGVLTPAPTRQNPLAGGAGAAPTGGAAAPAPAVSAPAPRRPDIPKQPPGVPQGRVAVYKGKDLVGHIPEGQIDDAMKQGYSLRPM